mgnify:FL=1
MKMKYSIVFLISLVLISIQCKSPTSSQNISPIFTGKVIDKQGNPVQDVDVHYIYSAPSSALNKLQNVNSIIQITFIVEKRSLVSLSILRYLKNDSLKTIVNDTLEAGQYTYQVDISKFTNGIYVYRLIIAAVKIEKVFFYLNPDPSTLVQAEPLTRTNSKGEFSIPYELFGFDLPLTRTNEKGTIIDTTHISTTIQILLYKTGYNLLTQSITIDTKKETNLTFTLISH